MLAAALLVLALGGGIYLLASREATTPASAATAHTPKRPAKGAGFFGIYRHILFPLSLPGFVIVIIWQFTNIWNEFLFAVTTLQKPELQPITVALRNLSGSQIKEWNVVMAGAIIAAVPTLIVYIVMGRYFIRGLLAGSVKV